MALDETVKRLDGKKDVQKETILYCSVELYQISDSYDSKQILQNIKAFAVSHSSPYVIAFHDKDIYTEDTFDKNKRLIGTKGQAKSPHYHVLLKLPYRMAKSDLAVQLGIEERWILKLKKESDFDYMIWYCTHEAYKDIQETL